MDRFLRIPDTLSRWPWPRRENPYYEEMSAESAAWLRSFRPFSAREQATFDKGNFGLLTALIVPYVDRERFRSACDLMNIFFAFDDLTDVADGARTRELADIVIDAVRYPERQRLEGEPVIGEMTRQFWTRYADAVVAQAQDRDEGRLRTTDEYFAIRRYTIGIEPTWALAMLAVDLPLEVSEHPVLRELEPLLIDMVILDNDVASYRKELAAGDPHNILTLVMNEKHLDLGAAVSWLASEYEKRVDEFLGLWPQASSLEFGPGAVEDSVTKLYLDNLVNMPRGCQCWIFESGRYFGEDGWRVRMEGMVELNL